MNLHLLPDVLVSSLILGSVYALIALGVVAIYRATKVLNFAHGQFILLGAYLVYQFAVGQHLPLVIAAPLGLLVTGLIGALAYVVFLKPLAGRPLWAPVMVTVGLATVMTSVMSIVWGSGLRILPFPVKVHAYSLPGNAVINTYGLVSIVAMVVVFSGFMAVNKWSQAGAQMRAAAENPVLAGHRGVNVTLIFAMAWGLAAVAAGVSGVTFSYSNLLTPGLSALGLRGFAPALVGGLDSFGGALLGSFCVALAENMAATYIGGEVRDAAAFAVILVVLVIRPYGLFGTKEIERV